ncbi:hypothetical protein D7Y13_16210 [Corallococcus praedator]|uniref:Uncharacterized protein n=1 Tax=Corallococcus praedator TaxID=2316724 RepID=A0ABX9QJU4_9BACT|nr:MULTISPECIES: hypothetical protein [Corallococcus]RKH16937.1 hypothetical protein D7X74_14070 [Corallococcus sp. CA047B]RKH34063.1 hypothetical protein D7X75_09665 [Corallococcus sp. CA031C]RKI08274.1 hypothetical protein D7Y13_16210 [Corallococcus praedator]
MALFWYLMVTLLGALGTLASLRVLERLVYGGGSGSLLVQAGMGLGLLMLATKALGKARALKRPAPPAGSSESNPS